ncbi:4Fe-4S dicluster-binding protein [Spirochaeta isovalerica]|uniref:Polyferredoxin n=1 Tax=Spirochaeta isovalerica TaxID=150 RepID=A0A841R6A6_9SPIO|nr:polyferredoxin [Spirochaeta isovalerica]
MKGEIKALKILLALYIFLCLLIAGLNYGLAPHVSEAGSRIIRSIWNIYENYFKTFLIVTGSWLTLRISGKRSRMQKRNFAGFIIAALLVHIIGPFLTGNPDLYFFAMPFPWSSTALQTLVDRSSFYTHHLPLWGLGGISASLTVYLIITIIVFTGTVLLGRRWQCSTLCLFNGFISETFSPAFPLVGKKTAPGSKLRKLFVVLKWALLVIAFIFFLFWFYILISGDYRESAADLFADIEVYKYLSVELLMAMFFWVAFTGRGYCYYCPLGTVLGWVSRLAGQRIRTDISDCIKCGKCNVSCPMGIEIKMSAEEKKDVYSSLCVGCGHCVDICPVGTLEYSTAFLGKIRRGK